MRTERAAKSDETFDITQASRNVAPPRPARNTHHVICDRLGVWNTPCDRSQFEGGRLMVTPVRPARRCAGIRKRGEMEMGILQMTAEQWIGLVLLAAVLVVLVTARNRRNVSNRRGLGL
jgi:hypothetical protein